MGNGRQARDLGLLGAVAVAALALVAPQMSTAVCDVIPNVTGQYRGALGTIDRPFSIPGDVGEMMTVRLHNAPATPLQCDPMGTSFSLTPGDQNVTLIFVPPDGGPTNAVVVSTDCAALGMGMPSDLDDCADHLSGAVTCVDAGAADLIVDDAKTLRFRFPDTDDRVGGPSDDLTLTGPAKIAITSTGNDLPCALATTRCADASLMGLLACVDELYERNGSCEAIPRNVDPLFGHYTALPPANDYEALCDPDSNECDGTATDIRFTVDAAGNVLVPVDWRGVILRPDGLPVARLVQGSITIDAFSGNPFQQLRIPGRSFLSSYSPAGIRLPPVFDPLLGDGGATDLALFGTADAPIGVVRVARRVPNLSFGAPSYAECVAGPNLGLPCASDEDCGAGGSCGPTTCHIGETDQGTQCLDDAACDPGAHCGPVLFDFSDRLESSVGPVLASQFSLKAENPVPIEGLVESPQLFAFVELEPIAATDPMDENRRVPADLNGDGDTTDPVIVLRDRQTAEVQLIGEMGSVGRAVARVHEPPFSFSAVAVEDDLVAFLEPEPLQGDCSTLADCDQNGDNDVFDSVLRVYRLGAPTTELTDPMDPIDVDGAPLVNGRSVVVSGGLVYYRRDEAGGATQRNRVVSLANGFPQSDTVLMPGFLSDDGRYVGFAGKDSFLPAPWPFAVEAYLHDRDLDGNGVFDEMGQFGNSPISVDANGAHTTNLNVTSVPSAISDDARHVLFVSDTNDLASDMPAEMDKDDDVLAHDRDNDGMGALETRLVSLTDAGNEATGGTSGAVGRPVLSGDGRFAAFDSTATDLVAGDTNNRSDVFVRDRDTDEDGIFDEAGFTSTVRVSVTSGGAQGTGGTVGSTSPALSADGRYVAFLSDETNLASVTAIQNLFVHDRQTQQTLLVGISSAGEAANASIVGQPSISADGRFVAFRSSATNLVPGDTNDLADVFIHDRDADEDGVFDEAGGVATTRASVSSGGVQARGSVNLSAPPFLSPDGRFVAFASGAADLVPEVTTPCGLGGSCIHVYLHDRLLRHTQILTVDESLAPVLSIVGTLAGDVASRGRYVMFTATSSALSTSQSSPFPQVYVRGPDQISGDLNSDGDASDVVLEVFDPDAMTPRTVLGEAEQASVDGGSAAFLAPDGSVHLSVLGAAATDTLLGQAASEIALSGSVLAAFVPTGIVEGEGMLWVYDWTSMSPGWSQKGPTANAFALDGDLLVIRAASDQMLHLYDLDDDSLTAIGESAVDFVVSAGENPGEGVVAFRTDEVDAGSSLNPGADMDQLDRVMRVYDVATDTVYETGQAATPCRLEACDPRVPYRINGRVVTFLTLESEQGSMDLDADGRLAVVVQTFKLDEAIELGQVQAAGCVDPLAGLGSGVCAGSGAACLSDDDCGGGTCFLPPGGCVEETATPCDIGDELDCTSDEFCAEVPDAPATFRCFERLPGACATEEDCLCRSDVECDAILGPNVGFCFDALDDRVRLLDPLAKGPDGARTFVTAGLVQASGGAGCADDGDCAMGEVCNEAGRCQADTADLKSVGAADADGDGILDHLDNCAGRANPDQADDDGDGVGNICLPEPAGMLMLAPGLLLVFALAGRARRS